VLDARLQEAGLDALLLPPPRFGGGGGGGSGWPSASRFAPPFLSRN